MRLFILAIIILSVIKSGVKSYTPQVEYLKERASDLNYNEDYGILVDYSISSIHKRLTVVDLKTKKPIRRFHVAHGKGKGQDNGIPLGFSNTPNSHTSSLGLAVMQSRGYSNYGINIKYWLKGLDKTNSNLEKRVVVLHSSSWITNTKFKLRPIVQSLGCPTVSNEAMRYIDSLVKKQDNKKILIYTFK